jgi:hypothetical protein
MEGQKSEQLRHGATPGALRRTRANELYEVRGGGHLYAVADRPVGAAAHDE